MFDTAGIEVEPLRASTPLTLPVVETSIDLETVWPGARNASLFDVVRHWAYAEPKDMGVVNWKAHVQDFTRAQNDRFPVPLDARELQDVAYSISTWVWAGGGAVEARGGMETRCFTERGQQHCKETRRTAARTVEHLIGHEPKKEQMVHHEPLSVGVLVASPDARDLLRSSSPTSLLNAVCGTKGLESCRAGFSCGFQVLKGRVPQTLASTLKPPPYRRLTPARILKDGFFF